MKLTEYERSLLATYHGNAHIVRAIRTRLTEAGLRWCPLCDDARPRDDFSLNGSGYPTTACNRHRKKSRTFIPLGKTDCERQARSRDANPSINKYRKRAAYYARRAAGLTGRQANYMEPTQ